MNAEVPKNVLNRIRKMLALGRDAGASEGERDNAMRMVRNILTKYNLDLAEVEGDPEKKDTMEPRAQHTAQFYGRPWARNICRSMARLMACNYLVSPAKKGKNTLHHFVGRHTNAVTAAYLAEYLINSIDREGHRQQREAMQGNAWFRSFAWGAGNRISQRVDDMLANKDAETALSDSKALVLVDFYNRELAANQAWIDEKYPELHATRRGKSIDRPDGFERGQAYGSALSLSNQLK